MPRRRRRSRARYQRGPPRAALAPRAPAPPRRRPRCAAAAPGRLHSRRLAAEGSRRSSGGGWLGLGLG
eukprot:scaffold113492_cov45-Phaeocystis_antarctica.AAC.1